MKILSYILRVIALAFLFGGSATVVFAVLALVNAAKAQGIPVQEAAAANAPIFYQFASIGLAAGVLLLAGESISFAKNRDLTPLTRSRYISSLLCVASTMIFAFGLVPPMKELAPTIKTNEEAHKKFETLHHISRVNFAATIVFALVSLLIPGFEAVKEEN